MHRGYIKLWRKIREWEWFTDVNTCHLFIYMLLNARNNEGRWRGIFLDRGEIIQGIDTMAERSGITVRGVRTAISHLKATREVTERRYGKYRILQLTNYNVYHSGDKVNDKEIVSDMTGKRQGSDKEVTDNKKEEKDKKEKNTYVCRPETEALFNSIDEICKKYELQNNVKLKSLDVVVERYVGKVHMKVELQHCISWMIDKGHRVVSTQRIGNWLKKAQEIQKREYNKMLERNAVGDKKDKSKEFNVDQSVQSFSESK